jgi:hypothetical protein
LLILDQFMKNNNIHDMFFLKKHIHDMLDQWDMSFLF